MQVIKVYRCNECNTEYEAEYDYGCPKCGGYSKRLYSYGVCEMCGDTVSLGSFTNDCPECGTLYNNFGQRLSDPSLWEPEDRYGCFGPQNYEYY